MTLSETESIINHNRKLGSCENGTKKSLIELTPATKQLSIAVISEHDRVVLFRTFWTNPLWNTLSAIQVVSN